MFKAKFLLSGMAILCVSVISISAMAADVVRPEEIRSKRLVVYDDATYATLESLWADYAKVYPSEYAYANWTYAARYAGDKKYPVMLDNALEKYPSNPILLYLKATSILGKTNETEGQEFLEKAISIDPNFIDPWFSLVPYYMAAEKSEKVDVALRKILESGVINDEIMDYNYNMLIGLEDNAIIITNGDNDTYPGWIMTRILNIRPDIAIVNRSLLNTDWYPMQVISRGVPRFIGKSELENMRKTILESLKKDGANMSPGGPFGDTLIALIIDSAQRAGRPVYISKTVFCTELIQRFLDKGRDLGLVTLVTSSTEPYSTQLRNMYNTWINDFRTTGLQSWRLKGAQEYDAARWLISNYAHGTISSLAELKKSDPKLRLGLFNWYRDYLENLLPQDKRTYIAEQWCRNASDLSEVKAWSRKQGIKCEGAGEK